MARWRAAAGRTSVNAARGGVSGPDPVRVGLRRPIASFLPDPPEARTERARWEPIGTGGDTAIAFIDDELNHAAIENVILRDGPAAFHPGAEAGTAAHRLIHDGRRPWYDADGNGAGAAQAIAHFDGGAVLAAGDIFVA